MNSSNQIAVLKSFTIAIFSSALLLAGACSHKKLERPTGETPKRMQALAVCYSLYVNQHQGHLPSDESTLKTFIRTECKNVLNKRGVADVNAIFSSDRDNRPLIVRYAKPSASPEFVPEMIVAHEETGVDGRRLVAFPSGVVRELDAAALDKTIQSGSK
jgi:hypothetical protein